MLNIGEASAELIKSFDNYRNNGYEITGTENRSFMEVTELMTELTGVEITFRNIDPIRFYFKKRNEGAQNGFAMVMTILHFLPRFQKEPAISDNFRMLTGKGPTTLTEFIKREKEKLMAP